MGLLINAAYAALTWFAAFTIGLSSWLGWSLFTMAILQSYATLVSAAKSNK